jgi:hypothetical protein
VSAVHHAAGVEIPVEPGLRSLYAVGDDGSREAMIGAKPDDRAERLKAALRENLRRRKAQARGREATEKPQIDDRLAPDPSRGKA